MWGYCLRWYEQQQEQMIEMYWKNVLKGFYCNISTRIAYKWHHSHISLCICQTGTTQTVVARNKGGNFIGQLCISVVPHCLELWCSNLGTCPYDFVFSWLWSYYNLYTFNLISKDLHVYVRGINYQLLLLYWTSLNIVRLALYSFLL